MEELKGDYTHNARVVPPPAAVTKSAHVKSLDEYRALYKQSIEDPQVRGRPGTSVRAAVRGCTGPALAPAKYHAPRAICHPPPQAFWAEFAKRFHFERTWNGPVSK